MRRERATIFLLRSTVVGAVISGVLALTGCGDFFPSQKTTGTGSGSGSVTVLTSGVDRAYVLAATAQTVSGFTIGTGTLAAVSGNPLSTGFVPLAAAITPAGQYLYVAGLGTIEVYAVASNGSLGAGSAATIATVTSLAISPDGRWMFGLDTLNQVLDEWQLNADGTLSTLTPVTYTPAGGVFAPRALTIAPNGGLIFAALGTAGTVVFTLNTSTGIAGQTQTLNPTDTQTSDSALAVSADSTLLYLARSGTSGGLSVYTIGTNGALAGVTGSPHAIGAGASSVALDGTGKYVYVANRSDSTISGFSMATGGVLTPLTGSPFTAGAEVSSIGFDSTGVYLVAAALNGSPDLAMYSLDATVPGKLDSVATSAVGTGASIVVLTR